MSNKPLALDAEKQAEIMGFNEIAGVDPKTCPPVQLGEEGKKIWEETLALVCTRIEPKDLRLIEAWSHTWESFYETKNARNGELYLFSEGGKCYAHPLITIENQLLKMIASMAKQLGFEVGSYERRPADEDDGQQTAESILKLRRG